MDNKIIFWILVIIFAISILIGIGIGYISYNKLYRIEQQKCIELYDICVDKFNECNINNNGVFEYGILEPYKTNWSEGIQ